MHFQSQLICELTLGTFLVLWAQTTGEVLRGDAALSTLYNNLLQREYAEPVIFPSHQVERKAQRSPSLRLRFGRRNDPDLVSHAAEKRWFDEVKQKPIRSPSLRLRFGRRSDPSMPRPSPLDMLMNEAYENQMEHDMFENVIDDNDVTLADNEDDLYNSVMQSQKLRNLLLFLNKYGNKENEGFSARPTTSLEEDMNEFERVIRKPTGPLRLRWGRSTGGITSQLVNDDKTKTDLVQKNKATEMSNEVEKSVDNQSKD